MRKLIPIVAFFAVCLVSLPVLASDDDPDREAIRSMYQQAAKAYDDHDYKTACPLFERALAFYRKATAPYQLHFNIGRCWHRAGELAKAVEAYERYLAIVDTGKFTLDKGEKLDVRNTRGWVREIRPRLKLAEASKPPVDAAEPAKQVPTPPTKVEPAIPPPAPPPIVTAPPAPPKVDPPAPTPAPPIVAVPAPPTKVDPPAAKIMRDPVKGAFDPPPPRAPAPPALTMPLEMKPNPAKKKAAIALGVIGLAALGVGTGYYAWTDYTYNRYVDYCPRPCTGGKQQIEMAANTAYSLWAIGGALSVVSLAVGLDYAVRERRYRLLITPNATPNAVGFAASGSF